SLDIEALATRSAMTLLTRYANVNRLQRSRRAWSAFHQSVGTLTVTEGRSTISAIRAASASLGSSGPSNALRSTSSALPGVAGAGQAARDAARQWVRRR